MSMFLTIDLIPRIFLLDWESSESPLTLALLSPFMVYRPHKILGAQNPVPINVSGQKAYHTLMQEPRQCPIRPLSSVPTGRISQNTSAPLVTGIGTLKYIVSLKAQIATFS